MINRVVLVGRLTKDPELKYTASGLPVTRFTVAVNRVHKNENGDRDADFINCIAWRKAAENLANFMSKGSLVGVDGRIQTGSYEGQDGKRVYTTEIIAESIQFLEPSNKQGQQQNSGANQNQQQYASQQGYQQPYTQPAQQNWQNQGQQQYGGQQYQQPSQQWPGQQQYPPNQQNHYRQAAPEDPYARGNGRIEVSEDDLPF